MIKKTITLLTVIASSFFPAYADEQSTALFGSGNFPSVVSITKDPKGFAYAVIYNSLQEKENTYDTATVTFEGVDIKIYVVNGNGLSADLYSFQLPEGFYTEHEWYSIREFDTKKVRIFAPMS